MRIYLRDRGLPSTLPSPGLFGRQADLMGSREVCGKFWVSRKGMQAGPWPAWWGASKNGRGRLIMRFLWGPLRGGDRNPPTILRPQQILKHRIETGGKHTYPHFLTTPNPLQNPSRFEQNPPDQPPARSATTTNTSTTPATGMAVVRCNETHWQASPPLRQR